MLVSLAKIAGVRTIFGTCSARNLQAASARGVQALDYGSDWEASARQAHPEGFDLVLDSVVLQGYLEKGLGLLKKGGKYIAYGLTNKAAPGTFSLGRVVLALVFKMGLQEAFGDVATESAPSSTISATDTRRNPTNTAPIWRSC